MRAYTKYELQRLRHDQAHEKRESFYSEIVPKIIPKGVGKRVIITQNVGSKVIKHFKNA